MSNCCDVWRLTFTDSPSMNAKFGTDVRPVITGVNSYEDLDNKPSINGVLLTGNKTNDDIKIQGLSNEEIEELLKIFV